MLLSFPRVAKEQFAYRETEELLTMLDGIAHKTGSRAQVFEDFLTMTVCALAGGTMEAEYLAVVGKYAAGERGKRPVDQIAAMFGTLVRIMEETRSDILGDLFQGAITYGEHAQFFTPDSLCTLMAELTGDDGPASGRVCDPCCGSGRMLLSMAKVNRNRLFVGQDADLRCVKITAINLALHNLYGYVIWGNSLTNERKAVFATGFNGKGVIRLVPREELPAELPCPSVVSLPEESEPTPMPPSDPERQGSLFDDLD